MQDSHAIDRSPSVCGAHLDILVCLRYYTTIQSAWSYVLVILSFSTVTELPLCSMRLLGVVKMAERVAKCINTTVF